MFDSYRLITKKELAEILGTTENKITLNDLIKAQRDINNVIPDIYEGYFARFLRSNNKPAFETFDYDNGKLLIKGRSAKGNFAKLILNVFKTGKRYWIEDSQPTPDGLNTELILDTQDTDFEPSAIIISQECFYPYMGNCRFLDDEVYKFPTPDWIKTAVSLQYSFIQTNRKDLTQRYKIIHKSLRGGHTSVNFGENLRAEDYLHPEAYQIIKNEGILANYV